MKTKKNKEQKISRTKLIKFADTLISLLVRYRDKNTCVSCGKLGNQCGHFISRRYEKLRFNLINCNCQCFRCNICLNGNITEYGEYLKKQYGKQITEELNIEAHNNKAYKLSNDEILKVIKETHKQLNNVLNKMGERGAKINKEYNRIFKN